MKHDYKMIQDASRTEALRSLRSTLQWLGDDVHYIQKEVDPIVEMCTITKAFDNSKALVANRIKGYPGVRMISNLYSTKGRTAKLHGMQDFRDIKLKILDCIQNPIAPKVVSPADAPCQELFIPKEDIRNVEDLIPIAQHTYDDGARIFGAGTHFFYGEPWVPRGGSQLSMYRMGFRDGQKYASINMVPGGGGDVICSRHPKGARIPCTVNICPPVGAELVSVSTLNPVIFPYNTDKIGLAGALQGAETMWKPIINQGMVRFLDARAGATEEDHDRRTNEVIAAIVADGEAFFGGTTWRGRRCMRISVSNWMTGEEDVARAIAAVERATRGKSSQHSTFSIQA